MLDADRITHALMRPGAGVHRKIRARFGGEILTPAGTIDRRALGQRVFRNRRELDALTRIIHPQVRRKILSAVRRLRRADPEGVVVLDIPLLVEAGSKYPVDALVVVSAPLTRVFQRLRKRSGWSYEQLKKRQSFQMPLKEKEKRADFIIRNSGDLASTRKQVREVWKRITRRR